jgi:small conductance mechanosensitive channel
MGWLTTSIRYLREGYSGVINKVAVALIILLIGFIIGRLLGKVVQRLLGELEINSILKQATKKKIPVEKIAADIVKYFVYFIVVIMALNQLGVTTTILYMVAGAIILIAILSVFLGVKDFIPNFFAGLLIHRKKFIKVGDMIKVKGIKGEIIHINLVETRIKTKSGDIIYIPNSNLTKEEVVKLKK